MYYARYISSATQGASILFRSTALNMNVVCRTQQVTVSTPMRFELLAAVSIGLRSSGMRHREIWKMGFFCALQEAGAASSESLISLYQTTRCHIFFVVFWESWFNFQLGQLTVPSGIFGTSCTTVYAATIRKTVPINVSVYCSPFLLSFLSRIWRPLFHHHIFLLRELE
jgi:hypothetical protein